MLLGENFLQLMILAFGASLIVGPSLALIRPPKKIKDSEIANQKNIIFRAVIQILVGLIMSIWAIATLIS